MPIYINKNNQQSGPYEDHVVIDQLRNGMLSPNDLGIRHGESTWQRLGDMFPNVSATPAAAPVSASPSPAPSGAQFADQPAKVAGGCRKPLGWTLFGIGLLLILGGGLLAIGTTFGYSTLVCDFAESDFKKVEELTKKYDAAKGTDKEIGIQYELERALATHEASSKSCADANATKRMFLIISVAVAFAGFIIAVIGFFIRRA